MQHDPRLPATINRRAHSDLGAEMSSPDGGWPGGNGGPAESEIDWRRWLWVLWRRKWWIIAATAIGTALAVWSARGDKPVYQAKAMVWVEAPEKDERVIEITNVFTTAGWIDLLQSYAVLDAVVYDLELYLRTARPEDRVLFSQFELLENIVPGLYELVVRVDDTYALLDSEGRQIQVAGPGEVIGEPAGFRWLPPDSLLSPGREVTFFVERARDVADRIGRQLEITVADPLSNFISLTYRGTNPEAMAHVLNAILERFVELATELKRQKLTKLAGTLEDQLELASERLNLAEQQLEAFRINAITLPDERRQIVPLGEQAGTHFSPGDPVFDRYFTLHVERDRLRQDYDNLQAVLRDLERTGELDAMRLEAIPSVREASSLMAALEELGRKEVEHRTLLYRYTEEHALVQQLAGELETLREQTIPALVRQLMQTLSTQMNQLDGEIQGRTAELQQIPPRAIEEARLRRDVTLAEQLYKSLQMRYKETQVAEAATQPNVRIVDRASPPAYPVQNTARLRIMLGFVLSLGLSLAGVIAHARFVDRRIQYPEQVVEDLGLPILGIVPNLRALAPKASKSSASVANSRGKASSSIARYQSHTDAQTVVESFRALRTQLTLGLGLQHPAVIAITSPSKGEGKSLITSNLALAFADPDRSTVLIDGDVRRGGLHRIFNINRTPGLAEYLRGEVDPVLLVKRTETEGLYFVPRGRFTAEVPELLDGEALPALIAQLKQSFKIILIDTPPLSAGVDAVMIGAHADAMLSVLRKGRTDLDLARNKIDSYARMLGIPIVGAILNDVDTEGPYRYYTYAYENYPEEE